MHRKIFSLVLSLVVISTLTIGLSSGRAKAATYSAPGNAAAASPNITYLGQVVPYLMPNHQKYCLGITGGSPYAYAWSTVWTCNNNSDQAWNLETVGFFTGVTYFEIKNVRSGLCLTPSSGTNAKSGDYLWQIPCIGTFSPHQLTLNPQLFQRANPDPTAVNTYMVFNTTATIKGNSIVCLGINGGSVYQGSDPILATCNLHNDQLWDMLLLSH